LHSFFSTNYFCGRKVKNMNNDRLQNVPPIIC
jgi:hypothetical protein